jgi:hypothetical protein
VNGQLRSSQSVLRQSCQLIWFFSFAWFKKVTVYLAKVAIDREFPAVRITDCLNAGGDTVGNPVHISPVYYRA